MTRILANAIERRRENFWGCGDEHSLATAHAHAVARLYENEMPAVGFAIVRVIRVPETDACVRAR
jgi:hypothetical protein